MAKKTNSDYWKKRFEILEEKVNNKATPEVLKVQQKLKQANKEIDAEIAKWYQRFADNNEISMREARKLLSKKDLAELKWDINEYIKYGEDNELFNGLWMKELENASAKYHISRLEALKIRTRQSIEKSFADYDKTATDLFGDIYKSEYYMTAFEVQKGFNVGFDIGAINDKQVDMILLKPWTVDKNTFSKRIWDSRAKLVNDVHGHLTRNILLGKAPDDAIAAIAKSFNTSKSQAGRLIMTESAYFASAAQKDCFNMLDVEQFEIVATLDMHTSEICQELDGKVFDMKDYEAGTTAPPFHPWCRTTTVPYFPDNYTERAARNADGKTEYVPGNMTYKDWKTKFVDDPALTIEYFQLKDEIDNYEYKEYEGIWKDPVTVKDYASKKSGIQGKKDYFTDKIMNSPDPDDVKKFKKLLDATIDFENEGLNYTALVNRFKEIDKEFAQKAKDAIIKSGGVLPVDDVFSQERKDNAIWAKDTKDADTYLRSKSGEVWRSATDTEKDAIYDYTGSYSKFNEPLCGYEYGTNKYLGVGNVNLDEIGLTYGGYKRGQVKAKIDAMTSIIEKSSYSEDFWVQRGVDYNGMDKFFNIDKNDFYLPEDELAAKLLGTTPTDYAFFSTGVAKGKGFSSKDIIMNIYAPSGTKMMYAEPFSQFGNGGGRRWDGVAPQSSFGTESEMIFQRETTFRITKVEKARGKIYIDMEVISQGVY